PRSQAGQDGGYQLASWLTVHGLMVQVAEHGGVLGYLVRPGDLDCRSGGFERDGIVIEDPKSDGGDRAPLDASRDDGDRYEGQPHQRQYVAELIGVLGRAAVPGVQGLLAEDDVDALGRVERDGGALGL